VPLVEEEGMMFISAATTLKVAPISRRDCSFVLISLMAVAVVLFFRLGLVSAADGSAVGLSLFFENSSMPAITLY